MDAVVAEGLVKHLSGEVRAVDGIELGIPRGRIFGLPAQNGSPDVSEIRVAGVATASFGA